MTGKLIGLVGYAGAGKTTILAEAIALTNATFGCKCGRYIQHHNFSKPIVNMLVAMGIPKDMVEDKKQWNTPLKILCGKTIRYAATTLGTEWGRDYIGQDVWARIELNQADMLRIGGSHVVIDNVRFPSEMDTMIAAGCRDFIAVERPGLEVHIEHESEQYIAELQMKCNHRFVNNSKFDDAVLRMSTLLVEILEYHKD